MNRRTLGFLALCFIVIIVTVGRYIPPVKGFQNKEEWSGPANVDVRTGKEVPPNVDSIQPLEGGHIPSH
jgi:hypothetical protein